MTYIPHHVRVYYEITITAHRWFDNSVGRALHRYRRAQGFESRSGLNSFQALISQLLKLFKFFLLNLCLFSPFLTSLVPLWFVVVFLVFFYLSYNYFQHVPMYMHFFYVAKITQNSVKELLLSTVINTSDLR